MWIPEDIHPIWKPNYNFQDESCDNYQGRIIIFSKNKKEEEGSTLDITLIIEETGEDLR